jgi:hypothetical protein
MSSLEEIEAAIEAHRSAAAAHEAAGELRRQAGVRLCRIPPSSLDAAISLFSYLRHFGE